MAHNELSYRLDGIGEPIDRSRDASGRRALRAVVAWIVRIIGVATLLGIVGLWLHTGGVTGVTNLGTLLTSIGRLTGLLGMWALLLQLLLLARVPILEWVVGFDRLTSLHKLNGKLTLFLILGHVGLITAGYALLGRLSIPAQLLAFLGGYTGMLAAFAATVLLILVVVTSIAAIRRQMGYQTWLLVHLMAYSAVALAWFHQIPTGQVFLANPLAAALWTALYVATLQLVILFRFGQPIARNLWYRLRVAEVTEERSGVVSLRITGHHLDALQARAGQYFLWRFLDRERWQEAHPFSLSAAPDGRSLRITVKDLGDFTAGLKTVKAGTRVVIEGPFGSFTDDARTGDRVALIAGGVGITPIRALLEEMEGDLTLVYRVGSEDELIFRHELDALARKRNVTIHYVLGDRRLPANRHLMSTEHLRSLIPDLARREIFLCGPPALMKAVRRSVQRAGVPSRHIHTDAFAY
jgi:predicted ferric reductase